MRKTMPDILKESRLRHVAHNTDDMGFSGLFQPMGPCGRSLRIISSDGTWLTEKYPWEHVSVSLENRCPNWPEMCFVKDLFWEDDEVVMQLHPAKSDYVNNHPYCLHLWRPLRAEIPLPPIDMVGVK